MSGIAPDARQDGAGSNDARHLLAELQVHQIELEAQNEELQNARAQLESALAIIADEKDAVGLKLLRSEERYRTLVEWAPDPVLVHRVGTILYVNPAAIKAFGARDASALVGRQTNALVHPDFQEQQTARMKCIIANQAIKPLVESRFVRLDGSVFDVEVQGTAIDYDGEPAIHVSIRDITQRKLAEEALRLSEERFAIAFRSSPIAASVARASDGRVISVNQNYARDLGWAAEEMIGRTTFEIGVWPDLVAREKWWEQLKRERRVVGYEAVWQHKDGSRRDVSISAEITEMLGESCIIGFVSDITEAKRTTAEHLQRQERARILQDMHDGVGAHISSAIRQLQSGPANLDEVLLTLRESLDQLKLSIDVLSLPAGDVGALLATMRYRLEPRFRAMGLTLEWDVAPLPELLTMNASAMRQLQYIFFGAFSNVMQHSHASVLRIEAKPVPAEPGGAGYAVSIRIRDNGCGYDTATVQRKGLVSMESRAQAIGARFSVSSQPGATVVEVQLP